MRCAVPMFLLSVLALMPLSGCGAVYSDKPVGGRPVVLDPDQWDGKWLLVGEWATIRVADAQAGTLELRATPKGEAEKTLHVKILQVGDWQFASFDERELLDDVDPEKGAGEKADEKEEVRHMYAWGRIRNEANQIIFWFPDVKKFAALVKAGKLPGRAVEGKRALTVFLRELKPEHLKLIMSEDEGVLFEWASPLALVREAKTVEAEPEPKKPKGAAD